MPKRFTIEKVIEKLTDREAAPKTREQRELVDATVLGYNAGEEHISIAREQLDRGMEQLLQVVQLAQAAGMFENDASLKEAEDTAGFMRHLKDVCDELLGGGMPRMHTDN